MCCELGFMQLSHTFGATNRELANRESDREEAGQDKYNGHGMRLRRRTAMLRRTDGRTDDHRGPPTYISRVLFHR